MSITVERTYIARGLANAKSIVQKYYARPKLLVYANNYVIMDEATGKSLSPICTGEGPAWRFAALMVWMCKCPGRQMPDLLDETMQVAP